MIPEYIFFQQSVLSALESANKIYALIVYSGDSPNNINRPTPSTSPILNVTTPPIPSLPYPPVVDLSVDLVDPNIGYNFYPKLGSEEKVSPDYSAPEQIIENINKEKTSEFGVRNAYGTGLKFRLFGYNIFHISSETANEIRNLSRKFSDTRSVGSQPGSNSDRSPTKPQYKLESIGQMYACPSSTNLPVEASSPTPTSSTETEVVENGTPDPDDRELDDGDSESRTFQNRFSHSSNTYRSIESSKYSLSSLLRRLKDSISTRQNEEGETEELSDATSARCLAKKTCLPIGGQSLWSALGRLKPRHGNDGELLPLSKRIENGSNRSNVLAIMAPMDSMAFFPDMAYGGSAEISSMAVLLAVSEAVGNYWRTVLGQTSSFNFQPVYFSWNAQSWGWAGSSRFLKDLDEFSCSNVSKSKPGCDVPFMGSLKFYDFRNLDKLHVINIGQLISPNALENFNLTADAPQNEYFLNSILKNDSSRISCQQSSALESELNTSYTEDTNGIKLSSIPSNKTLYPLDASHSFKRYYRYFNECSQFDIISINNFKSKFSNRYYHSMFDHPNLTFVNQEDYRIPLYNVAKLIAKVVAKISFGDRPELDQIEVQSETINEVITCMTSNWTECSLTEVYLPNLQPASTQKISMGNYAGSFYPSTRLDDSTPSWAAKIALIRNMFSYFNRYDLSKISNEASTTEPDETIELETTEDPAEDESSRACTKVKDCDELNKTANANVQNQTEWHTVFCTKGECVLSDTYLHDAFGTAIKPDNDIRSNFTQEADHDEKSQPPGGAWTESIWDKNLGLCGSMEDTALFGGIILGIGVVLSVLTFSIYLYFDARMFKEISVSEVSNEVSNGLTRQPVPP